MRRTVVNYYAYYDSPIGTIRLTSDGISLTSLHFGTREATSAELSIFDETSHWLDIYFSGHQLDFTPRLLLLGTEFQIRVWQALLEIPYGQTISYGKLARRIGCRSAQAVGQAVGKNPISIIVPCHRVIGSDGSLVGYEWGLERKQYLLLLEKQHNPK